MSNLGNKEIMARNIKKLMDEHNIDRNELCKAIDVKYTTLADWINAKTYPRIDKIELMANYFHVSKSTLVEDEEDSHYYLNDDAKEMAEFLFKNPEYRVLFDASRKVKKEDIEFVKEMLDRFRE